MTTVHTVKELKEEIEKLHTPGSKIGFVPTMGALHQGHLSLIKKSCEDNDISVVSIFVNPTQFNNKTDLEKYPRDLVSDMDLLNKETSLNIVFAPSVDEVYPEYDTRVFDFGQLDKVMEGRFRPGHFNGVAQVVSRLFDIVKPDIAYFGEKDFQQLAIVRQMVKQLSLPIEIVGMPILRENNGLAMSSRNERLKQGDREKAAVIYKSLLQSKDEIKYKQVSDIISDVVNNINAEALFEVEYFEIVDGYTLQKITNWADTTYAVGCIAIFCGDIRLIDNITYYKKKSLDKDEVGK